MGALNSRAWIIRNDGREARVLDYPKGVRDDLLSNLSVAVFLCKYDRRSSITRFINWFFADLLVEKSPNLLELYDELLESEIQNKLLELPRSIGDFQSLGIDEIADILYRLRKKELYRTGTQAFDFAEYAVDPYGNDMWREMNQSFIFARIGGRFVSDPDNRDLYFLVSSRYFDWTPICKKFVQLHADEIDTVTVERYVDSDNREGFHRPVLCRVYKDEQGNPIHKVAIDDFLKPGFKIASVSKPRKPEYWKSALASGISISMFLGKQSLARREDIRQEFTTCLEDEYELTIGTQS